MFTYVAHAAPAMAGDHGLQRAAAAIEYITRKWVYENRNRV